MSFDGAPIEQFSKWWPKNFAIAHKTIHPRSLPASIFCHPPTEAEPNLLLSPSPAVFSSPQTAVGLTQTATNSSRNDHGALVFSICSDCANIGGIQMGNNHFVVFFFNCAFASSMRINLRSYFSNVFLSVCFFLYVCRQQAICVVCFLDWVSVVRNMGRRCRPDVYFENPFAINFQQKGF